jgi:Flp pilus assembly protein TadD
VQLAGALARSGRPGEAIEHYADALRTDPANVDAAFGRAMAFVRLRRYVEARDSLVEGMKGHPDQSMSRPRAGAPPCRRAR